MSKKVNYLKFGEVSYSNTVSYWDEKTEKFRVWKNIKAVKIRDDIDYYSLFNGNTNDMGRLFLLIHNINYDNYVCRLDKHLHRQNPITSNEELMKLLNIRNRSTFKKFIDHLEKNEIIAITYITSIATRKKLKRYVLNPIYGIKSTGISPSLYMLFHKSIDKKIGNYARICLATLAAEQEGLIDDLNSNNKNSHSAISQPSDVNNTITDSNTARDIARRIDIAEWLNIDNSTSFSCILPDHKDNHVSASIYHNKDHQRYVCQCCNNKQGLDSIDLARILHGFSYLEAVEYLCTLQGYEYKVSQINSA